MVIIMKTPLDEGVSSGILYGDDIRTHGSRPKVDNACGRARIPRDIVSAIITTIQLDNKWNILKGQPYSSQLACIARQ